MERTPDDPNDEPTQMADYDYRGGEEYGENYGEPGSYYSEYREPGGLPAAGSEPPEPPTTPWYLKPLALIGWGVLTALLITALVWGMVRLVNGNSGQAPPPTTSVTSTAVTPGDSPTAPGPAPAAPGATTAESAPPATTAESTTAPSTTESPTSTAPTTTTPPTTTEPPTTTAPTTTQAPPTTTTAPPTTTAAAGPPSEIVIPLPPGL